MDLIFRLDKYIFIEGCRDGGRRGGGGVEGGG